MPVVSRTPAIGPQSAQVRLRSFDGAVVHRTHMVRPRGERDLVESTRELPYLIGRGQGLSYAAASFSANSFSIEMSEFDRIIDFDSASGEVIVEAGIKLGALFASLEEKGRYLPIQPGHLSISVGGCVAADVHGKNQARDGNFREQVLGLTLFHPSHGVMEVDSRREPALFEATCGGYGLTGIIMRVRLATQALPGRSLRLTTTEVDGPEAGASLMKAKSASNAAVYSWFDFTHRSGAGFVISGQFETGSPETPPKRSAFSLSADWRARLPFSLQNALTARLVNTLYSRLNRPGSRRVALEQAFFPAAGNEHYFALFGSSGLHEYQAVVPDAKFQDYVNEVRAMARHHGVPLVLASGKSFAGKSELLRFAGEGVCFAVNVPRSSNSLRFMSAVDDIALRLGCRPNLIKDSRLPRAVVEACYPEYDRFRRLLHDWDPGRRFRSELSERLGL